MGKSITAILGIQGWWQVKRINEDYKAIHLSLTQRRKTAECPRCHKRTITGYDNQPERSILHTTVGIRRCILHVSPRRFICSCSPHNPFVEHLPGICGRRRTSIKFDAEIIHHLKGQAFSSVTDKLSLSYPAQRARLVERVNPAKLRWNALKVLSDIHLGLDGHHLVNKRFVETIAEVKQGIPLGILPNSKKYTIITALRTCPDNIKLRIRSVAVDMDDGTIAAIKSAFPDALVVIDHFHVIADANKRVDEARRIEQEAINFERGKRGRGKIEIPGKTIRKAKEHLTLQEHIALSALLTRYPRLHVWYEHKERLRSIYTVKDRQEAAAQLDSLISMMLLTDDVELTLWGKSLKYYKEEILNFFVYRTTNAYTEGLHVRCKLVQRISSGFRNPEVYIRKALLFLIPLSVLIPSIGYPYLYPQ